MEKTLAKRSEFRVTGQRRLPRLYSGINPILLDLQSMVRGYTSKWWGTFGQWQSLGAQVKKRPDDVKPGHWGTSVVLWKQIKKTKVTDDGEETTKTFPLLRYFTLFNLEQVQGEHARTSLGFERFEFIATVRRLSAGTKSH